MISLSLQNFNSQFFVNRNCKSNSFAYKFNKNMISLSLQNFDSQFLVNRNCKSNSFAYKFNKNMISLSLQNFNSQFFVNRNCKSNSFPLVPKKSLRIAVKCSLSQTKTRCDLYDYSDKLIEYRDAWSWQKMVAESKIEDGEDALDSLMILQHPPVYTLGTRSSEKNVLFDMKYSQIEVHRTERGGEVTYHGPGQLVMYPIMNLRNHKMDLHWYLRALEDVVINVLSSTFGLTASRIDGLTGVWVGTKKVAAIGIRVSRWITYHGVAVNVTTDLTPFKSIVPCGIKDYGVSSIIELLKDLDINPNALFPNKSSGEAFALMDMTRKSLLKEFSDVFQVDFVEQELHDLKQIK